LVNLIIVGESGNFCKSIRYLQIVKAIYELTRTKLWH